jgi:fatty-acyl-CoA synthase
MSLAATLADRLSTAALRRAVARRLAEIEATPSHTLRDEIEEWVAAHGPRPALVAADGSEKTSYAGLADRAHRWARWTILHGVGRGDRLALLMTNRPERLAAWLGVAETGAVAAVLDPTLDGAALAAAITLTGAAHLVVDATLLARLERAAPHLTALVAVWVHGPHPMAYMRIDEALEELSGERLRPADRRTVAPGDDALWLLGAAPEPLALDHRRVIRAMHAASAAAGARADDRLLVDETRLDDAAGLLAPGVGLTTGGLAVLRPAETPTPLADDLARHRPTLFAAGLRPGEPLDPPPRLALALGAGASRETSAPRILHWRGGALLGTAGRQIWRDGDA